MKPIFLSLFALAYFSAVSASEIGCQALLQLEGFNEYEQELIKGKIKERGYHLSETSERVFKFAISEVVKRRFPNKISQFTLDSSINFNLQRDSGRISVSNVSYQQNSLSKEAKSSERQALIRQSIQNIVRSSIPQCRKDIEVCQGVVGVAVEGAQFKIKLEEAIELRPTNGGSIDFRRSGKDLKNAPIKIEGEIAGQESEAIISQLKYFLQEVSRNYIAISGSALANANGQQTIHYSSSSCSGETTSLQINHQTLAENLLYSTGIQRNASVNIYINLTCE